MDKSDVAMEDAEKQPLDAEHNGKEPENKPAEKEHGGEELAPTATDNADAVVNGAEESEKANLEKEDQVHVNIDKDDKTDSKSKTEEHVKSTAEGDVQHGTVSKVVQKSKAETEIVDHVDAENEVGKQINSESMTSEQMDGGSEAADQTTINNESKDQMEWKNELGHQTKRNAGVNNQENKKNEPEENISAKSETEGQTGSKNGAEDHTGAVNGANGHTDNEVKEKGSTVNDMEIESPPENAEKEKPGENVAEEESHENGREYVKPANNLIEEQEPKKDIVAEEAPGKSRKLSAELCANEAPQSETGMADEASMDDDDDDEGDDEEMRDVIHENEDKEVKDDLKDKENKTVPTNSLMEGNNSLGGTVNKLEVHSASAPKQEAATPDSLLRYSTRSADLSGETTKSFFSHAKLAEGDDGTPQEQALFMKEIENFYRERAMDFKPPKFYGQPLNCLKLWRAVIRLGGYDRVTGSKLWRQVGESFHPPKTCTTVSWTFRIFYEKALLEYERHKRQSGELELPVLSLPESSSLEVEGNGYQGSGSGRARRDAAARAMQGWQAQRLFGYEAGEPVVKDKNLNNMGKREKNLKSIGSLKQKRPNEMEHPVKAARTETSRQLVTTVVDVGPPADWVKINVRESKDCFEVYALVPGLLREEVRVQSDPAGRLVITGQPEQPDNPWGITAFKKVVSLPARIDPLHTSAVVSLHGRLFVRVPFEQQNV